MFALLIYVTTKNRKGSAGTLPFQSRTYSEIPDLDNVRN